MPARLPPALDERALKETPALLHNPERLVLGVDLARLKNRTKRFQRRRKRQVRLNREVPVDCFSKERLQECRLILDNIRQLTLPPIEKMEIMKQHLVKKGVLSGRETQETLNKKIMECLQCRSNDPRLITKGKSRDSSAIVLRSASSDLPDILDMFEAAEVTTVSSITFIPGRHIATPLPPSKIGQTTIYPIAHQSKPTQVKVSFDTPVTALPRSEDGTFGLSLQIDPKPPTGQAIYPDLAKCMSQLNQPNQQLSQSIPVPTFGENKAGLPPIIVPTAETTKTSQQFQFSPQVGWSSMPICFSYGPNNMIQVKPGVGIPSSPLQSKIVCTNSEYAWKNYSVIYAFLFFDSLNKFPMQKYS